MHYVKRADSILETTVVNIHVTRTYGRVIMYEGCSITNENVIITVGLS